MLPLYQMLDTQIIGETIALVAFNRPEAANALNAQMALELKDFFNRIHPFYTTILTGRGKHFCAGADLRERQGMDEAAWYTQHQAFEGALHAILNCPAPIIAAVNGAAIGGGLELALACDFIYASEHAIFAFSEATLGIMPGLGGTQTFPRAVGSRRAKEYLFTGKKFSAADALQWGMVNRVCTPEKLLDETTACAHIIAANAPLSVKAIKQVVNKGIALPLHDALPCELAHYRPLLSTHDRKEGIDAFNEKRKAVFRGE